MQSQISDVAVVHGNHNDPEYDAYLARIGARFAANVADGTVFQTNAEGLFAAYLDAFPVELRQYHTCHACRNFVERFGGLVTIAVDGSIMPAVWNAVDAPGVYKSSIEAMTRLVRKAKVTGPFLSAERVWGQPVTGIWHHLSVTPPLSMVYKDRVLTAGQKMAEKREDFKTVMHALNEFTQPMIEQALGLLRTDALYRSEKVLGQAEWLHALHVARAAAHGSQKANVVWRAIATAPAGFCHPRSSMIGTLLEDIAAGLDFGDVSRKFAAKMHPLQYLRPQAAPSVGAIVAAEKLMEQLGGAAALSRRFARIDEIVALWTPAASTSAPAASGVFGHLKPKGASTVPMNMRAPTISMTFEKFVRTVLPTARSIDVMIPSRGNFVALVTAADPDAPPILQWDREDCRNPVSWYLYHNGSNARQWGIDAMTWGRVLAVTLNPAHWHQESSHHGKGAVFVIAGAKDSQIDSSAIFPETLRSEFHAIRSTIEAYSKSTKMGDADGQLASGLMWDGAHVRVNSGMGSPAEYKLDRWD